MKKLFTVIAAIMLVVGMTTGAMAAQQVEVKTNSEGVTGAANACEKAGNITLIFDAGTVIQDGDWVTADLPIGVTLCRSIDFAILGAVGAAVPTVGGGGGEFTGGINATVLDDGATLERGIWAIKDTVVGDGVNGGIAVAGAGNMWFRVTGAAGSSRLTVAAYDDEGATVSNAANIDGNTTFTVNAGGEFQIKILDGQPHDGTGAVVGVWAYNDTDAAGAAGEGVYGDDGAADTLQTTNDWDNSYCITVDSAVYAGSTVNVSINSGGTSGNNFLTFNPSNPQVAHLIAATTIQLDMCKADESGFVSLAGGQGTTCLFSYNTAGGYCTDIGDAVFTAVGGNEVIITNTTGNFFSVGDDFRVVLRVSGNGAYFGGVGDLDRFTSAQDPCAVAGTDIGETWTPTTETAVAFTSYATGAGCAAPDAGQEVVTLTSSVFTGIDTSNKITAAVPSVIYDPAVLQDGDRVTVTVELWRLPCGLIFTGDRIVAEFVDTCPTAAALSTLYYPYSVALDGSQGWWFGMTIGNPSAVAGSATITVIEMDGDVGTYTIASIAANGLTVLGAADVLNNLTADAANTGTLGDSPAHIVVACNFAGAGGFAMTGNGVDSTGYTAYGKGTALATGIWTY